MDIKEIVLKAGYSTVPAYWLSDEKPIACSTSNFEKLVAFAEALIAEIAKQNEPVAWYDGNKFYANETSAFCGCADLENLRPVFTFPPTAEQIANETAEAWQPIETAPKDGTVFLGYKRGQFRECYKVQREDCDMWCFGGASGADDLFPNIKPTHWKPLPKAPNGASS